MLSNAMLDKQKTMLIVQILSLLALVLLSLPTVAKEKTCALVLSYHQGYEWNDGIEEGAKAVLEGQCRIHTLYMDSKRNPDPKFIRKAALRAKAMIDELQPDVVIAADDNASKYLVKRHFKDADIPFVFCGINWTVSQYGYPYSNVTGMIEVAPIKPLLKNILKIVPNATTGIYLSADVLTEHKDYLRYKKIYRSKGIRLRSVFVTSMQQWMDEYKKAQDNADFVVLNNNSGINDWDSQKAEAFVLQHARVLSVSNYKWMMPYTMFSMTKSPQEQGRWAASSAVKILFGRSPKDIPISVNREWNNYINKDLLAQANIHIADDVLENVKVFSNER
jgi:ABC-type uncharacterized transport system substrate-binding protein